MATMTPTLALNIGQQDGQNFFNISCGRPNERIDVDLQDMGPFNLTPEYCLTADLSAVQFMTTVAGKTTSKNTKYSRSELRECLKNGSLAAWSGKTGTHRMSGVSIIRHVPKLKGWVCFAQIHGPDSDLARLQLEADKLVCRNTNPADDKETTKTIQSKYNLGDAIVWDLEVIDGLGYVYIGGLLVQNFPATLDGCYFKAGAYIQSNVDTEKGDKGQYTLVEIIRGSLVCWHTGYAAPNVPGPIPIPVPIPVPQPPAPPEKPNRVVVMIIRHGEKPADKNNHSLNDIGRKRAAALAELFTRPNLPTGLYKPDYLYASKGQTSSNRPVETMTPLSVRMGKTIDSRYAAADAAKLAKVIRDKPGIHLVCWAHGEIPDLFKALGKSFPNYFKTWPDSRFDIVCVFAELDKDNEWALEQVPELLLAGDSSKHI
jgi:hypothetical protein